MDYTRLRGMVLVLFPTCFAMIAQHAWDWPSGVVTPLVTPPMFAAMVFAITFGENPLD